MCILPQHFENFLTQQGSDRAKRRGAQLALHFKCLFNAVSHVLFLRVSIKVWHYHIKVYYS